MKVIIIAKKETVIDKVCNISVDEDNTRLTISCFDDSAEDYNFDRFFDINYIKKVEVVFDE